MRSRIHTRALEGAGLASLLGLTASAVFGSVFAVGSYLRADRRSVELVSTLGGLLASIAVAVVLILSARADSLVRARITEDPIRSREEELPAWIGRACEIGIGGALTLFAGCVLATIGAQIPRALGAAEAVRDLVSGLAFLAGVVGGALWLARLRRSDRRDADRIAAQLGHAAPGVDVPSLAQDVWNHKWHHVAAALVRWARERAIPDAFHTLSEVCGHSRRRTGRVARAVESALGAIADRDRVLGPGAEGELAAFAELIAPGLDPRHARWSAVVRALLDATRASIPTGETLARRLRDDLRPPRGVSSPTRLTDDLLGALAEAIHHFREEEPDHELADAIEIGVAAAIAGAGEIDDATRARLEALAGDSAGDRTPSWRGAARRLAARELLAVLDRLREARGGGGSDA